MGAGQRLLQQNGNREGNPGKTKKPSPVADTEGNAMTETPVMEIFSDYI